MFRSGAFLPDHPRIRGEHQSRSAAPERIFGSSPHTRGALDLLEILPFDNGIIPAYAGSTTCITVKPSTVGDHPRIRGEHHTAGA